MDLLKLPKYKKVWSKERVNFGYSEKPKQIFLILEDYNPTFHHGVTSSIRFLQWEPELYPCNDIYFFEIFKYLKKYQKYLSTYRSSKDKAEIKIRIRKHLIRKHSKQLYKDKQKQANENKLTLLNDYSKLINKIFENLSDTVEISLVIQKKIGYKYYENITYK